MTLLEGLDVFAWVLFVVGAIWVPIKYHRAEYGPFQQKALLVLGILPGAIILIILGVYRDTHGGIGTSAMSSYQPAEQAITQVKQPSLECGVIQSVINKSKYIELMIQFESSNHLRRFEYLNQGQYFEANHRICIRQDQEITENDKAYLRKVD